MHFGRRMGKFLLFTEGLPDSTVCIIAASRRVALGLGFSSIYSFHFVDFGQGGVRSDGCWIFDLKNSDMRRRTSSTSP